MGVLPVGDQHRGEGRRGRLGLTVRQVRRTAAVRPAGDEGHDLLSHRGATPQAGDVVPPDQPGELEPAKNSILHGKGPTSRDRFPAANGGLFSTATDYARFCQMILDGGELEGRRYVKPESIKLMTTVQTGGLKTGFTEGTGGAWAVASSANRKG